MRRRQQVERDTEYLIERYHLASDAIKAVQHALPAAVAFDRFRRQLKDAIRDHVGVDLWDYLRDQGALKLTTTYTEHFQRTDGSDGTRKAHDDEVYGSVVTYSLFAPQHTVYSGRLQSILDTLSEIYDPEASIEDFTDDRKLHVAGALRRSLRAARELFAELDAQRRFTSNADIATICGWARSEGSPVRLIIVLRMNGLFVGRDTQNGRIVEIPADFNRILRPLSRINLENAAE